MGHITYITRYWQPTCNYAEANGSLLACHVILSPIMIWVAVNHLHTVSLVLKQTLVSPSSRIINKHQHSARPICVSALSRLSAWRPCLSVCQEEDAESPGPLKIVSMPTICKLTSLQLSPHAPPLRKNHIWSDGHVTLEKESLWGLPRRIRVMSLLWS